MSGACRRGGHKAEQPSPGGTTEASHRAAHPRQPWAQQRARLLRVPRRRRNRVVGAAEHPHLHQVLRAQALQKVGVWCGWGGGGWGGGRQGVHVGGWRRWLVPAYAL